jgi:hypothetical protein
VNERSDAFGRWRPSTCDRPHGRAQRSAGAPIATELPGTTQLDVLVGVFGVLSQSVRQRTREFGVRIALGASRQSVIGLVVGHATRITLVGLVVGLALAAMLGRLMATLIHPVTPWIR